MNLRKYFEDRTGFGVLATADEEGNVNAAVFPKPHHLDDGTIGFVMSDRLTYRNLQSNESATYLFRENPEPGSRPYEGVRLSLKKVGEDDDQVRVTALRRRSATRNASGIYLIIFSVEKTLPLIGVTTA